MGCSHGVPTSHLPVCYFAFSLVGANFFPVPWSSVVSGFVCICVPDCDGCYGMDGFFSPRRTLDPLCRCQCAGSQSLHPDEKSKLVIFCRSVWPTFNVGWCPEGTFDLAITGAVEEIVFRPWLGHPNQVPYNVIWRDLVEDSPFLD